MDTMETTKIVGGLCGALLIFLLFSWGADALYSTESAGSNHDVGSESAMAYPIEVEESGAAEVADEGPTFAELLELADAGKGEKVFNKCKACHKVGAGENGTGPTMFQVVGRDIGSVGGFNYSGAMAEFPGDWTPENLNGFLEKPKSWMPGTGMGFAGLKKGTDRANLIAYLQTLQ